MIYNYNPLEALYYTFIAIIFGCLFGFAFVSDAQAATLSEQAEVLSQAKQLCNVYLVKCDTRILDTELLQAYTDGKNTITISTAMGNYLTKDELRSVLFHEVGHAAMRHMYRQRMLLEQSRTSFNLDEWIAMRHRHELEADKFASYNLKFLGFPNRLEEALRKIIRDDMLDSSTKTHPATTERIKIIRQIKGIN